MGMKEKFQEKKKLIIGLGVFVALLIVGVIGLAVVGGSADDMDAEMIVQQPNFGQPIQPNDTVQEPAQMSSEMESGALDVAEDANPEEIEAATQTIMNELEMLTTKQEEVTEKMENLQSELASSNEAIEEKSLEIENLNNQLK